MKKIKSYYSFLLESILYVNDDLISILKRIDHPIANILLELVGKDIKLTFNALKASSKNDMINFLPDSKVKEEPSDWDKSKNSIKVGRIVKDILLSNGHSEFLDKDIESFVTKYKAAFEGMSVKDNFKIVKGDEIRKWYLSDNNSAGTGTLQKSCMRYERCQEYFGIYTENIERCNMVVMFNEVNENIIDARALIWYPTYSSKDLEIYVDRIYYTQEQQSQLVTDWIKAKFPDKKVGFYNGTPGSLSVELENSKFDYYPYMDTFTRMDGQTLNNDDVGDIELTNTDGTSSDSNDNRVYCELEDEYYDEEDVVWIESRNSYVHRDNARYSEREGEDYWQEDVVYSSYMSDYIDEDDAVFSRTKDTYLHRNDAVEVFTNIEGTNEDYLPEDEIGETYAMDEDSGSYYVIGLLEQTGEGNWSLSANLITCYEDNNEADTFWTEIDAKLFGLDINMDSSQKFSKKEYFEDAYGSKIYTKQLELIKELIKVKLESTEDIEAANEELTNYENWHTAKMMTKSTNYWKLQKLYEFGGWENLISLKKKLFLDNFYRIIDNDYFKECITKFRSWRDKPYLVNIKYTNQETNTEINETIDILGNIDEVFKKIYPQFIKIVLGGMNIKRYAHYQVQSEIVKDMTEQDAGFYKYMFEQISDMFYADKSSNINISNLTFLKWRNSNWVDYWLVSDNLSGSIIHTVNSELA